jgi:hypothetical protein
MKQFFEKEGLPLELESKRPLPLDDDNLVWLVSTGKVDLFTVVTEPGEFGGARRHLVRLEEDRVLFGFNPESHSEAMHIVAVGGFGTRLLQMKLSRFMELARESEWADSAARLLEEWL